MSDDDESPPDVPEISVDDVAARLGSANFYVFDNNGASRWKRSHVPGAVNLNAHTFEASDLAAFPKDATMVFYCSGPG